MQHSPAVHLLYMQHSPAVHLLFVVHATLTCCVQLGPVADIALGVGRVRARVARLIDPSRVHSLQRTASGQPEANTDAWIICLASQYEACYSAYMSCMKAVGRPCRVVALGGPGVVGMLIGFLVLMCVAWPFGLAFAPLVLFIYIAAAAQCDLGGSVWTVIFLIVPWLAAYFGWIYPHFCPVEFASLACSVSSVLIQILKGIAFLLCLFNGGSGCEQLF